MKEELFARLMKSANQALEHAQGKRELRTTVLPKPPAPMSKTDVKQLRERFGLSQAVFAYAINVSPKTVQAWESGHRYPDAAALKLLRVAETAPAVVFGDLQFVVTKPNKRGKARKAGRGKPLSSLARAVS